MRLVGSPSPLSFAAVSECRLELWRASVIGASNMTNYPLMEALYGRSDGSAWKNSSVQLYGWINPGFNLSTSKNSNLPRGITFFPIAWIWTRRYSTSSVCRIPSRPTMLIGAFGRQCTRHRLSLYDRQGWLSQQLLLKHQQYGFDPLMLYGDLYIPQVADGPETSALGVTSPFRHRSAIGREQLHVQPLAPVLLRSIHADRNHRHAEAQQPLARQSRFICRERYSALGERRQASLTACVAYTFNHGNDEVYPCASGINSGKYAYNNVQLFVTTWYHKFNQSWHMATEAYYEYQREVPSVFGPITPETNTNAAFCPAGQDRCFAGEWAVVITCKNSSRCMTTRHFAPIC